MTEKARAVLTDCDHALELLADAPDPYTFRVLWVAGVALARAVGHVLDKVDGERDAATRKAVDSAWRSWKADWQGNAIFWDFIENERNQVLKQYEMGFFEGDLFYVSGTETTPLGWQQLDRMRDGQFANQRCRDVLQQAINWWERELTAIEADIRSQANGS